MKVLMLLGALSLFAGNVLAGDIVPDYELNYLPPIICKERHDDSKCETLLSKYVAGMYIDKHDKHFQLAVSELVSEGLSPKQAKEKLWEKVAEFWRLNHRLPHPNEV